MESLNLVVKAVFTVPEKLELGAHRGQEMKRARKTATWLSLLHLQTEDSEDREKIPPRSRY